MDAEEIVAGVKKANEAYHKAINALLSSSELQVEAKVNIAASARTIFLLMQRVNEQAEKALQAAKQETTAETTKTLA